MNPRKAVTVAVVASVVAVAVAVGVGPAARALSPDRSGPAAGPQHDLDIARDRWKVAGLSAYRYDIGRQCFCEPQRSALVVVRGRRAVRFPAGLSSVATVPRLFAVIQRAIDAGEPNLAVAYGPRGVPRSIGIDVEALAHDGGVRYTVEHFNAS